MGCHINFSFLLPSVTDLLQKVPLNASVFFPHYCSCCVMQLITSRFVVTYLLCARLCTCDRATQEHQVRPGLQDHQEDP